MAEHSPYHCVRCKAFKPGTEVDNLPPCHPPSLTRILLRKLDWLLYVGSIQMADLNSLPAHILEA